MSTERTEQLIQKANQLIEHLLKKNLTQAEVAKLISTSPGTLSKLKSKLYFPKNGSTLVEKLDKLKEDLDRNPKETLSSIIDLGASKKSIFQLLIPLILILSVFAVGFFIFSKKENTQTGISVDQAFATMFSKDNMLIDPFSKSTRLPCYQFQGKWELDDKNPYTIVLKLNTGVYYYRSKKIEMYAWCGNQNGDQLNGLELFTNELWKDERGRRSSSEMDSLKNFSKDENFLKLAEGKSFFSDRIGLVENEEGKVNPVFREGKKIARYQNIDVAEEFQNEANMVIQSYIASLTRTKCDSIPILEEKPNGEYILQFDCTFFAEENALMPPQEYSKRIRLAKK